MVSQAPQEEVFSLKRVIKFLLSSKELKIIAAVGILIYFNSLFNGFVMDDENQIVNADIVHSLSNLPKFFAGSTFGGNGNSELVGGYYRPLPTVIISLLYMVSGPNPFLYHLTQVFLHLGNAALVFLLFKHLLRKPRISLFLALLFLVHPVNSEAVNYVSAMQTTLCFFFGLLALLLFLKQSTQRFAIGTGVLLLLSLLSKETGIIFIGLILYLQWLQKNMNSRALYFSAGGVIILYAWLRFFVAHVQVVTANKFIPLVNAPLSVKLVNIPPVVFYYLHAFLYPDNIAIDQNWVVRNLNWSAFYLPLLFCTLLLAGMIAGWFYLRKKDTFESKVFMFFALWFIAFMVLALPIIPLDFTVADRWFYFPVVGLLGMTGIAVKYINWQHTFPRWVVVTTLIIVLGVLGIRTVIRNSNWYDGLTLYAHDAVLSHDSFDLENNLGTALLRAGDLPGAELHIKKSLTLAPDLPEALLNLGIIYEQKQDISNAEKYYLLAARQGVSTGLANYAGDLLMYENNASAAAALIEKNISKYPRDQRLWLLLAAAYQRLGNQKDALKAAQYAYNLGQNQQSVYVYNQILQNNPVELK